MCVQACYFPLYVSCILLSFGPSLDSFYFINKAWDFLVEKADPDRFLCPFLVLVEHDLEQFFVHIVAIYWKTCKRKGCKSQTDQGSRVLPFFGPSNFQELQPSIRIFYPDKCQSKIFSQSHTQYQTSNPIHYSLSIIKLKSQNL